MRLIGQNREYGIFGADLAVALGLIVLLVAPLAHAWLKEHKVMRGHYHRAIAMELVDGEMEILAAGEGMRLAEGLQEYRVTAAAVTNLPPGRFMVERTGRHLRLEWVPSEKGRRILREAWLP